MLMPNLNPGDVIVRKGTEGKSRRIVVRVNRFCPKPEVVVRYLHSRDYTESLALKDVEKDWEKLT